MLVDETATTILIAFKYMWVLDIFAFVENDQNAMFTLLSAKKKSNTPYSEWVARTKLISTFSSERCLPFWIWGKCIRATTHGKICIENQFNSHQNEIKCFQQKYKSQPSQHNKTKKKTNWEPTKREKNWMIDKLKFFIICHK